MTKNKPTILVNDKEMSQFGVQLYLLELRFGLVKAELSEKEKADYTRWKDFRESRNQLAKKLERKATYHNISERAYVIEQLGNKLESLSSRNNPKVHAHTPKKGSEYTPSEVEGAVTAYICKKCGQVYEDNTSHQSISNPFIG